MQARAEAGEASPAETLARLVAVEAARDTATAALAETRASLGRVEFRRAGDGRVGCRQGAFEGSWSRFMRDGVGS